MNILIAIPCYGGNVSNLTFHSLLNTLRWLNDSGHNVRIETLPTESLISRARNKFVTKFLENKEFNGTHLLFIDADIGFNIENLKRIIEFDRAMSSLRAKRNALLAATDFYALSDNTLMSDMSIYRQSLRDITEGLNTVADVNAVVFPTKP